MPNLKLLILSILYYFTIPTLDFISKIGIFEHKKKAFRKFEMPFNYCF